MKKILAIINNWEEENLYAVILTGICVGLIMVNLLVLGVNISLREEITILEVVGDGDTYLVTFQRESNTRTYIDDETFYTESGAMRFVQMHDGRYENYTVKSIDKE